MSEYDLTLHLVLPAAQSRMESGDVITYQDKQYRVDETMISGDQVEYILFLKSIHG
jgi:two-component SAPR family response regulator